MPKRFVEIETNGTERLLRTLRRVEALNGDKDRLLGAAGGAAQSVIIGRFDRGAGPGGIPWPKSKRAEGKAPNIRGKKVVGKTLIDSAELLDSLTVVQEPGRVEVGFQGLRNPAKAPANQFGASGTSAVAPRTRVIKSAFGIPLPEPKSVSVRGHARINNLPARPMLGMDDEMRRNVDEVARLFMLDLMQQR